MKGLMAAFGVVGVLILSGCTEEPKTRAWYMANRDALEKVNAKCIKNGTDSDNCITARETLELIEARKESDKAFGITRP